MSKKFYESYIIIDGNLEDNAVEELLSKYNALFAKNEIEVVNTNKIGRRRLAYPIQKRTNGFYACFEINAETGLLSKIERAYQLDENILRYLTIHVSDKTKKEKEEHFKFRAIQEEARLKEAQAAEAAKAEEQTESPKTEEAQIQN